MKEYRTSWMLETKIDLDKEIYNILSNTLAATRAFRNKQLFFQYFTFLYVAGARRIEPFLGDIFIKGFTQHGIRFVKIIRISNIYFFCKVENN